MSTDTRTFVRQIREYVFRNATERMIVSGVVVYVLVVVGFGIAMLLHGKSGRETNDQASMAPTDADADAGLDPTETAAPADSSEFVSTEADTPKNGPLTKWEIQTADRQDETAALQELGGAARWRAETEYLANQAYLQQQRQILLNRQYKLEQQRRQSEALAQYYYQQAQQQAAYEVQREMNEYRSQMSERFGALGGGW